MTDAEIIRWICNYMPHLNYESLDVFETALFELLKDRGLLEVDFYGNIKTK